MVPVDYEKIENATGNFSKKNLIGMGGSCKVYKGRLFGGPVAIKRFNLDKDGDWVRACCVYRRAVFYFIGP